MLKKMQVLFVLMLVLGLALPVQAAPLAADDGFVNFTILHTNDFHGQLEQPDPPAANAAPGVARTAYKIKEIRAAKTALNQDTLLFDGGDIMQGSLLSNIQKGLPTIAYYKSIGYDAVTYGNHEFDWGQTILGDRVNQAKTDDGDAATKEFNFLAANITTKVAGSCAGWDLPSFVPAAYQVFTVQDFDSGSPLRIGVIGVSSIETPYITIVEATDGLCFKDPTESILHYYDALDALSDVIIVLSHNGLADGGYGYGFTVTGDTTLAANLIAAGKPVQMIIGGHSHTDVRSPTKVENTAKTVATYVVQAHTAGRKVGQADIQYNRATGNIALTWTRHLITPVLYTDTSVTPNVVYPVTPQDPATNTLVAFYASNPAYQVLINTPVFYTAVPIVRDYNGNGLMGEMVNDAVYGTLNNDAVPTNDVDMVFNNPGGLRADITCTSYPCLVKYGAAYNVLPFGNATAVGSMTGVLINT